MSEPDLSILMKGALRRLAKAVVVITTRHGGQRYAMAATAVSELSMDPPSLLICVNQTASLHGPLSEGADFCVNILHGSHEPIAAACSGEMKGEARFGLGDWRDGTATDVPYLDDAQASFLCLQDARFDYGTHSVFIGRVKEVRSCGEVDPLVYVDGRFTIVKNEVNSGI